MTNKEKYKKAFSALQISDGLSWEVERMANLKKKNKMKAIAATIAGCILIGGTGTAAYAANVGGIQRTVQIWIHGDQTNATLKIDEDGSYTLTYPKKDGTTGEQAGGGIAIGSDGSERPLTEDEIKEELNSPDIEYKNDGTVWLYYQDQKIDITDKFDGDICYVKIDAGKKTLYVTVKRNNGFACSEDKYISPDEFN
ncbi:MAG: hypothetical protein Q4D45_07430 [Lachnospiraceae bacterium]|nr:hypothetical protein [Lachnospiraceae bacterium]